MIRLIKLLLITVIFFSCEKDALDEKPLNFISSVNFYKTPQDADAAVLGIYATASSNPFRFQFIETHSDIAKGRGSWISLNYFDKVMDQSQIARATNFFWIPWYQMINIANSVLARVPAIEMNETVKNSLLAEARFLRAMGYFDLVRGFGPVPLRLIPTEGLDNIAAPRAPEEEVYAQIIEDLKIAENDLPNTVGANTRRASKWAAKLMLAQVYLTRENWAEAAAKAEEVINSGQYSLITVSQPNDFYKIFAVNSSVEDIMSVHYSSVIQDDYVLTLHLPNIPAYNNGSTGFYTTVPVMTSFLGNGWNDADLRKKFNLYTEYVNSAGQVVQLPSLTPILFKKFIARPDGIRSNSRPILRFAEAYLIYAEASAMSEGAPSALALERLNIIRRRAYAQNLTTPSVYDYPAGLSKQAFRDSVIQERGYEFIHEQRRWWDLKRTNTVKEKLEAAYGIPFNDARLLFPIPQDEINNNPLIPQSEQNPGY